MTWIYLLKKKSEVFEHFQQWRAMAERQSGKHLKTFRSDNGGEFVSIEFSNCLSAAGIIHQTTIPGNPQQNGVAERFNRTLLDMARAMIHGAGISKKFWGEALTAANYIHTRSSTSSLDGEKTPFELWHLIKPSIHHLRVFGCKVSVLIPEEQRGKLDARSWTGTFVGYSNTQKGYRIWNNQKEQIFTVRDLIFYES